MTGNSDHEHVHDHGEPILSYADDSRHDYDEMGRYPLMAAAMRDLLIERSVITAQEVREYLEFMDSRDGSLGGKIVARAWSDADYKARLLADGTAAVDEFGVSMAGTELVVVENTAEVHNLIVCTLCSCYPRTILGLPPDWYKSKAYRSRAVNEPRKVIEEFGTVLPASTIVRVHDSNADMRYLVLPVRPANTAGWDEERLADLVTRDCLVGVVVPAGPQ
ncbi:MAG: nitrile hydratase subunit alpha [Pseudomonadota bacterium]|nr:nitrile hydratase subunit alpha [Pseudomonadota bacterium]